MSSKNVWRTVSRVSDSVTGKLAWISYAALGFMALVVFVDVCGRYIFNKPLKGGYELVLLAMTVAGGFAILYTASRHGHVAVDLFAVKLSKRTQLIMQTAASLLGFATWATLAYWTLVGALRVLKSGETTDSLRIPVWPFQLLLVSGIFLCCLVLLIQVFNPVPPEEKPGDKEGGAST